MSQDWVSKSGRSALLTTALTASLLAGCDGTKLRADPRALDFENRINFDGKPFSGKDLEGRNYALAFFLTSCGDICPFTMTNAGELQLKLSRLAAEQPELKPFLDYNIVLSSVDPSIDRVETTITPEGNTVSIGDYFAQRNGGRRADEAPAGMNPGDLVKIAIITLNDKALAEWEAQGGGPTLFYREDNEKIANIPRNITKADGGHSAEWVPQNGDTRLVDQETPDGNLLTLNSRDASSVEPLFSYLENKAKERYRESQLTPDEKAERGLREIAAQQQNKPSPAQERATAEERVRTHRATGFSRG